MNTYNKWNLNLLDHRISGELDFDEAPTDDELDCLAVAIENELRGGEI